VFLRVEEEEEELAMIDRVGETVVHSSGRERVG
jgi:hypothetical protein